MMHVLSKVVRARTSLCLLCLLLASLLVACAPLEPMPTSIPLAVVPTPSPPAEFTPLMPTYTAGPDTTTQPGPLEPVLATPAIGPTGELVSLPTPLATMDSLLPVHYVAAGETMSSIAAHYGVDVELLKQANASVTPDELRVGQPLLIPLSFGEVHYTVPGDTLLAIATLYNVSLDELLKANIDVLDPSNPDFVPANVLLTIPQAEIAAGYDCTEQPPRTQVISYTVQYGEGLFCLARKFGLSITTLLNANPHLVGEETIEDGVTLVVPPEDGTVYTITASDVRHGVRPQHLLQWYGVTHFDDLMDWHGNPVSPSLAEGQALFIRGADLLAGPFTAEAILAPRATPAAATPRASPAGNAGTVTESPGLSVTPAAGALRPPTDPWIGTISEFDTGYCGEVVDGYGWSGSLGWPVNSRSIDEDRHFRPGHTGIDINVEIGAPVYAAATGVVIWSGFSKWGGGMMVVLAHGNSWQSYYAHLSSVTTQCGATVASGDLIGFSGQSGMASWPHLHFEVRFGGFSYDPVELLP